MHNLADATDRSEHWQDLVNTAELLLLLDKGAQHGLCPEIRVNTVACHFLLKRGQQLGFVPDILECRMHRLQSIPPVG